LSIWRFDHNFDNFYRDGAALPATVYQQSPSKGHTAVPSNEAIPPQKEHRAVERLGRPRLVQEFQLHVADRGGEPHAIR